MQYLIRIGINDSTFDLPNQIRFENEILAKTNCKKAQNTQAYSTELVGILGLLNQKLVKALSQHGACRAGMLLLDKTCRYT